jgi:LysR family glycine cleavage system transcriptional activator
VIAPRLFDSIERNLSSVLEQVPLLALVNRPIAWEQWAETSGADLSKVRPAARYEHFAMLIQATVSGAGAALLPDFLIEHELADGSLVALSPAALTSQGAYYLVYPGEKLEKAAFRKFRHWLLKAAA